MLALHQRVAELEAENAQLKWYLMVATALLLLAAGAASVMALLLLKVAAAWAAKVGLALLLGTVTEHTKH